MSLAGKFVVHHAKDYSSKGVVVDQLGDIVLIRWDKLHGNTNAHDEVMIAIAIADMAMKRKKRDELPDWYFFETREALESYWKESMGDDDEEEETESAAAHPIN